MGKSPEQRKVYYLKNRVSILERAKQHYADNRERILTRQKSYYGRRAQEIKQYQKTYTRINAAQVKEKAASYRLLKRYGITLGDKKAIMVSQNFICPLCCQKLSKNPSSVAVDHCHKSGKIRGVVHRGCNVAVARLGDDITAIKRLAAYLLSATAAKYITDLLDTPVSVDAATAAS